MITLIGDVHGLHNEYLKIIEKCDFSIQLGDFGFNYKCMDKVDPSKHKILGGNHDNYDLLPSLPHNLGDFGTYTLNGISFFFIRGELSVDKMYRTTNVTWWKDEELTQKQARICLDMYENVKPDIVLSHGCPAEILPQVVTNNWKLNPSFTSMLLDACFDIHKPNVWVFGHHHNSKHIEFKGTDFICLDELETMDIKRE